MTATESRTLSVGHTVSPNGFAARIFLAFLATAGLFYVNIMPAIVDGLIEGLSFSAKHAGLVASANVYGAATGALLIVFVIKRIRWRPLSYSLLSALIVMDILSIFITSADVLIGFRFLHGVVGGALVGTGFSVIARTVNPDRTFGVLLFIQFGLGGLGNLYIPRLVPVFGTQVLFISLIAFSVVTLCMVPFLGRYDVAVAEKKAPSATMHGSLLIPLLLVITSIFLFQAANNGLFAFIIGLGKSSALSLNFITTTLAASGWIGIFGAVFVIVLYTRFGRTVPLATAMVVTVLATWALHYSHDKTVFFVANCIIGITWAFVMSYLLGLISAFDRSGQMAALGGFASKMGLASGPMVGGLLLGDDNYAVLINIACGALLVAAVTSIIPASIQDKVIETQPTPR